MEKAAFQLGCNYGYLKAVTPSPQFFEKMAKKLHVDPLLLMAVFNKQALEKTANLPLALIAGGIAAAPGLSRWFRRTFRSPYGPGAMGLGMPSMSRIGGMDPKAMSDIMAYGAQMKALNAQNQMINRMFQPQPVYQ